ncbi:hypothetical protein Zmor_020365 [Zophobas morio]|uniref:Uncharacterized protein n=1 Tax=Zophobas morio TaxID=2755281 RepID=A0AA38I382_9CUCU|nr:hypothetical protein Zmor_020365 [Zophobas morio]
MVNRRKVVAVGDYCGKTYIIQTFVKDELPEPQLTFVNFDVTDVEINGTVVELHIWDTCEKERFEASRIVAYKGANAFLIFFSIYGQQTFENVKTKWVPEVRKHGPKNVPIVLVGTHCKELTLRSEKGAVKNEDIEVMVREVNAVAYVECSADNKYNLEKVFETVVAATLEE